MSKVRYVGIKLAETVDSFYVLLILVPLGHVFNLFCKVMNTRRYIIILTSGSTVRNAL